MITEITVTSYITEDGRGFETRGAAEDHELVLELVAAIEKSDLYFEADSSRPEDIAEWFFANYHLRKMNV